MPPKHEHVLTCNLSKRQRQLYDEYMGRSEIRSVMSGGNFMGVINVLMQLRKVRHKHRFQGLGCLGPDVGGRPAFDVSACRCMRWSFCHIAVQQDRHDAWVICLSVCARAQ